MLRKILAFIRWYRTPTKTVHAAHRVKGYSLPPGAAQARMRPEHRKSRTLTSTERTSLKRSLTEQIKTLSAKEIAAKLRHMQHVLEETSKTSNQVLDKVKAEQDQVFSQVKSKLERQVEAARSELRGAKQSMNILRASYRAESSRAARATSDVRDAQQRVAEVERLCASLEKQLAAERLARANEGKKSPVAEAQNVTVKERLYTEEQLREQMEKEKRRDREDKRRTYEARWRVLLLKKGQVDENNNPRPGSGEVSFLQFPWPTFKTPTLECPTSGDESPFSTGEIGKFLNVGGSSSLSLRDQRAVVKQALLRFHSDKHPLIADVLYPPHSDRITEVMNVVNHALTDMLKGVRDK